MSITFVEAIAMINKNSEWTLLLCVPSETEKKKSSAAAEDIFHPLDELVEFELLVVAKA